MFDTMKAAHAIKDARIKKNMTQMNLADEMGVSYQAVSNWERGNSMPDISKLGQLCEVLEISMTELLGNEKQSKTIEKVQANSAEEKITFDELQDILPVLPPQDTKRIITENVDEKEKLNIKAIIGMAPFLDEEYLDQLVERIDVTEQIGDLIGLAPFLSEEALDKAATLYLESGKMKNGIAGLTGLAPFMEKETLDKIVMWCLANNNKGEAMTGIVCLAPFLEEETLRKIAEWAMKSGDVKMIQMIAPFM